MTAIVIPVRLDDEAPELRWTLRSIATHVPDPDIWLVGHRPPWVHDVHWIPTCPTGSKSDRGCQQTRTAATHPSIPDAFWWWDDDMARLTPLYGPEVRHGGPIRDWVERFEGFNTQYVRALHRTAARLPHDALMYDLHVPFWIRDKRELETTMNLLPDGTGGWLWRTIHGNRLKLGGYGHPDVKIYKDDPIPNPPGQWVSWEDRSLRRLTPWLADRFSDPSPWEGSCEPAMMRYTRPERLPMVRPFTPTRHARLLADGWHAETVPGSAQPSSITMNATSTAAISSPHIRS